jgi:hypothetical protein
MGRAERRTLERLVQDLDRDHPDWSSREIEGELRERSAVDYGNWADLTPNEASRLRAIQRWRGAGAPALAARQAAVRFPYLWPLGERQRHELEPAYAPASRLTTGSWRVFLYNCSPEILREVHVVLDRTKVVYSPFLAVGRFSEVHWQRVGQIKVAAMTEGSVSRHDFSVRFVVAKGTKEARLDGTLLLDGRQGWIEFDAGDGRNREIE